MKRTILFLGLLGIANAWLILPGLLLADQPLPPPTIKEVWSHNKQYCAVMEPRQMITTVYRIDAGDKRTKVWAMFGWFRVADLANDGNHLVVGHPGINLIPLDFAMDDIMIYFFCRGELIRTVSLSELVPDKAAMRRTASHFLWGSYLGLDAQDHYTVKTVEERVISFDVKTGKALEQPAK